MYNFSFLFAIFPLLHKDASFFVHLVVYLSQSRHLYPHCFYNTIIFIMTRMISGSVSGSAV